MKSSSENHFLRSRRTTFRQIFTTSCLMKDVWMKNFTKTIAIKNFLELVNQTFQIKRESKVFMRLARFSIIRVELKSFFVLIIFSFHHESFLLCWNIQVTELGVVICDLTKIVENLMKSENFARKFLQKISIIKLSSTAKLSQLIFHHFTFFSSVCH